MLFSQTELFFSQSLPQSIWYLGVRFIEVLRGKVSIVTCDLWIWHLQTFCKTAGFATQRLRLTLAIHFTPNETEEHTVETQAIKQYILYTVWLLVFLYILVPNNVNILAKLLYIHIFTLGTLPGLFRIILFVINTGGIISHKAQPNNILEPYLMCFLF